MAWHKRLKFGFDVASKITASKPPLRKPVPNISHNNPSSKFTSTSNHPIGITNVSRFSSLIVHKSSPFRCSGSSYRHYHVARRPDPPNIAAIIIFVGFGIGVAICFGNVETIPYTKRKHLVVISNNLERKIGVHVFKMMKAEYKGKVLPKMDPESVRVRMILKDVVEAMQRGLKKEDLMEETGGGRKGKDKGVKLATSHLEGLEWEVLVVKNRDVNACCLPGGKIVVFTGLLKYFKTNEEIATIIGHEVGHAVARHLAEKFTMNIWRIIGQLILKEFVNPDLANASSIFLIDFPFSRMMEREADYIGILLMASAGYNPRVAPKVFQKMGQIVGGSGLEDYISTHPSGKTRSKLLSEARVMQEAISVYEEAIARRELAT